jgi:hypothetical protein
MATEVRGGNGNCLIGKFESKAFESQTNEKCLVSVPRIYIFDEKDNLLHDIRTIVNCHIYTNPDNQSGKITIEDTVFNFDLLQTAFNDAREKVSDFMTIQKPNQEYEKPRKISYNNYSEFRCKVAIVAETRDNFQNVQLAKYIFPKCKIKRQYCLETNASSVSTHTLEIDFFEEYGKLFDIIY